MAKDKDYVRMIHTVRWLRLRKEQLSRHPMCERCRLNGDVTAATEVHHVRPVEWGMGVVEKSRLMYDPGNLESLCHDCHVAVHTEMGRSGRERTKKINAEHTAAIIDRFFGE